jgi:chromosome segregation ATPase
MMAEMGTRSRNSKSPFLQAAEDFDDELANFQRTVEATLRAPLNSAKQLERATQSLHQVAECEQRLSVASQGLSRAIASAHQQQMAQNQQVSDKAQAIAVRTAQFQQLMQGYQALGVAAMSLNSEAAALAGRKPQSPGTSDVGAAAAWTAEIVALEDNMATVAQTAQDLIHAARSNDFEDIARQAESVRQQLLAARGKLAAFTRGQPGAAAK